MRKGTWVLLLLMTACLLGGCSKESAEQTEITLIHGWGSMESEHVRMRQIYKDFEKEHPEIKLNLMSMTSSDEVIKKTKNMLSVGEVPDLIFTGGYGKDSVYRFMEEKNKAADLMPYLEKDQEFADSVAPEIISYWQKDGKMYCCLEGDTGITRIFLKKRGLNRYRRPGMSFWRLVRRYRAGHRMKENR